MVFELNLIYLAFTYFISLLITIIKTKINIITKKNFNRIIINLLNLFTARIWIYQLEKNHLKVLELKKFLVAIKFENKRADF